MSADHYDDPRTPADAEDAWCLVMDAETEPDFKTLWALDRIVMGLDPCYQRVYDHERDGL